jgi:hypothetical protein
MNKNEKALSESIAVPLFEGLQALVEAINLNTQAVRYLADVRGYKADSENPTDDQGIQKVKLELVTPVTDPDAPLAATVSVSFDDLRAAVNRFAGVKGKENTLNIIKKFASSGALKDVAEADYDNLIVAVS